MKNSIILLAMLLLSSCANVKKIGDLNVVSNRNVDSGKSYVLIKKYVGGSKRDIRRSRSLTMEEAVDKTVKSCDRGEFLKNAKIYIVTKRNKMYFVVEGDIWGE